MRMWRSPPRQEKDSDGRDERVITYEVESRRPLPPGRHRLRREQIFQHRTSGAPPATPDRLPFNPAAASASNCCAPTPIRFAPCIFPTVFATRRSPPHVDDNYRGKKNNLFVSFHIVEGAQTRIADLKIDGNQAISTTDLLGVIGSTPGQPYSESDVASDRNNILAMYYNDGFPEARFRRGSHCPATSPNEVQSRLPHHRGPENRSLQSPAHRLPVHAAGNHRAAGGDQAGRPLREGDVVETQRQLYNLGVFNRVQIAPQNPNGADPQKAVVVDTEEGSATPSATARDSKCSARRRQHQPERHHHRRQPARHFRNRALEYVRPRANAFFQRPRQHAAISRRSELHGGQFSRQKNLSLQLTGFADKTQDINTFTSTRFEGALQLVQKLSPSSSLLYRYFYRRVEASHIANTINAEEIPLLSQPTLVSGFGVTYARDRRDNPSDAKHGNFNTVDVSFASTPWVERRFLPGLVSEFHFHILRPRLCFRPFRALRSGTDLRQYHRGHPHYLLRRLPPAPTQSIVPLPERFFAGGGTSMRGFRVESGRPARSLHRISDWRPGDAGLQPGIAFPDEIFRSPATAWADAVL